MENKTEAEKIKREIEYQVSIIPFLQMFGGGK